MIENNPENVGAAFDLLLEQVEAEIEFFAHVGADDFTGRKFGRVREALERAEQVTAFREKILALQEEWGRVATGSRIPPEMEKALQADRGNRANLPHGVRTPEETY